MAQGNANCTFCHGTGDWIDEFGYPHTCKYCEQRSEREWTICPHCGMDITSDKERCPICKRPVRVPLTGAVGQQAR